VAVNEIADLEQPGHADPRAEQVLECVHYLEAKHLFCGKGRERQAVQGFVFDAVETPHRSIDGYLMGVMA